MIPRGKFTNNGGVISSGHARTCLADAMCVIFVLIFSLGRAHFSELQLQVRSWFTGAVCMRIDEGGGSNPCSGDSNVDEALSFAHDKGFTLKYQHELSPRLLFQMTSGNWPGRMLACMSPTLS